MSDKLRLCPRCGAEVNVNKWSARMEIVYQVQCKNCGNKGPLYLTRQEAIEIWNIGTWRDDSEEH